MRGARCGREQAKRLIFKRESSRVLCHPVSYQCLTLRATKYRQHRENMLSLARKNQLSRRMLQLVRAPLCPQAALHRQFTCTRTQREASFPTSAATNIEKIIHDNIKVRNQTYLSSFCLIYLPGRWPHLVRDLYVTLLGSSHSWLLYPPRACCLRYSR